MNLKEKIIHIFGGFTEDELMSAVTNASIETKVEAAKQRDELYDHVQRIVVFRHYEYAKSLEGESLQGWIDKMWNMLEQECIAMGGNIE